MERQVDMELTDDANDVVSMIDGQLFPWSQERAASWNRRVAIHPLYRLYIRIFDEDRKLIWETITAPPRFSTIPNTISGNIESNGEYRLLHRKIHLLLVDGVEPESPPRSIESVIQFGCSLDLVRSTIAKFDGWLLSALFPLFLGAPILASILASWLLTPLKQLADATERLVVESDRLIDRTNNGDEIDRLAETLNSLMQRVRSQLRENEDWIANSAHQLRGPLTAIISNVEVVSGRIPDGKSSDMLQRVLSECEYLKRLVNQLLLLGEAKAERHQMVRNKIAWHELVEKSSDFYEAVAQSQDIEIHFTQLDPCTVVANREHLRFLIHNIIDNAIKYTPAGGRIDVSLSRSLDGRTCCLSVRDTGIGISPEDLPKIGRRFFRSNSGRDPANTPRGSGLGLHIVRSIVESLGGEFEINSQLGKGTEIRVRLPLLNDPLESSSVATDRIPSVQEPPGARQ